VFFSYGVNVGASINLERNVFCGAGSTIMTGVKNVGKNSLIGAGALVVKDLPDYAIVVGNPAKILKYKEKEK
jgi:acetyltransferase-like isoleucine patch superfamily enzyme